MAGSGTTPLNLKRLARMATCLMGLVLQGCFSFTTPEYVLKHRDEIQEQLKVQVDISDASSFTGDVDTALTDIEKNLSVLPEKYRMKIRRIKIRDGFFAQYGLVAPFVGAYTSNDGTVFVRNANITRFIQTLSLFPRNDTLIHELMHSVHFHEMRSWRAAGRPSPEFEQLIKAWEYQYFGDVNDDGELDDRDIAHINARPTTFDADGDGVIDSRDVELAVGALYVEGRWFSLRGAQVLVWMGLQWLAPRPAGFASAYAKTYVWEDAAETKRFLWRLGLLPALYAKNADEKDAQRAWQAFRQLKRDDPLLARKVFIVIRYIAAHEKPERLSAAWTHCVREQGGIIPAANSKRNR